MRCNNIFPQIVKAAGEEFETLEDIKVPEGYIYWNNYKGILTFAKINNKEPIDFKKVKHSVQVNQILVTCATAQVMKI